MIRVIGVSKDFRVNRNTVPALSEISIEIVKGEFISIIGTKGCGKSTLLRIIAGLIQPGSGEIYIEGQLVQGPNPRVGLVFQRPSLLPWRTVAENLSLPNELVGYQYSVKSGHVEELLEMTGLDEYQNATPRELTAGMQQLVSICMALILDPPILLMDEPFGALDAITREHLSISLLKLWSKLKKTVVFVTHNISEAVLLSDRIIVLSAGPGRVICSIPVSLPRPRSLDMLPTAEFQDLTHDVQKAIERG